MSARPYRSIGDVLNLLQEQFPDVTISKIRFLESKGLVDPERTPSGYRKFYDEDIDRLRYILAQQRDNFLPLRVIRELLESPGTSEALASSGSNGGAPRAATALLADPAASGAEDEPEPERARHFPGDPSNQSARVGREERSERSNRDERDLRRFEAPEGGEGGTTPSPNHADRSQANRDDAPPPSAAMEGLELWSRSTSTSGEGGSTPSSASPRSASSGDEAHLTLAELATASGSDVEELEALEEYGLIAGHSYAGVTCYDAGALEVARLASRFRRYGIEARHLRSFKHVAERQAGLLTQVVTPLLHQRNPSARQRAREDLLVLSGLAEKLVASLLETALAQVIDG